MKKVLLMFYSVLVALSCSNGPSIYQIEQESIATGIKVDTLMFSICFYDNVNVVKRKFLNTGLSNGIGELEYHFPDKRINYMAWHTSPTECSYINDSLYILKLTYTNFESTFNNIYIIKEIFDSKYGKHIEDEDYIYWFKGNLKISIWKGKYCLTSIAYENMLVNISNYNIYEDEYGRKLYSKDYWDQIIKPKKDSLLKISSKDI